METTYCSTEMQLTQAGIKYIKIVKTKITLLDDSKLTSDLSKILGLWI